MDERMLKEYIDACELAEEERRELQELEKGKVSSIIGKASGSNQILRQRMERAESIKCQIEEWMSKQPMRMQRIIRYKVFERLSWEQTAEKMGRGATGDSVRMEYRRFFKGK